jgi:two-component system CheB/CheR fusion protein
MGTTAGSGERAGVPRAKAPTSAGEAQAEGADDGRIVALERELGASKDPLRSVAWESQRGHDGLHALNEELLVRNEELLGVNRELVLAKDAQAAANEELRTLTAELRARNEVVEDLNRRKDLFLATLSHELRTPLTSLLLQTQLLRRGRLDAERIRRAADGIERAAHAQARLIDDLLDVSRIVTGKLRLELQSVGLASIVQSAVETMEPTAEKRQIALDRQIDDTLPPVAGDPARLLQAVLNLLTNAIKFTPDGGRVRVQLDAWGELGRIRVSDTGIGIAAGFLPAIFERFSQEDRGVTRTRGGLGLGLAIVRYIVEAHGGGIVAESAGVGTGATFTVHLPLLEKSCALAPAVEVAVEVASAAATAGRALRDLRVLVVEDDPGTRDALTEMLRRCGAEVRSVDSAACAMRAFDELAPDVLVSDVAMPDEDGYHLLARIRARGAQHGGDIPALALTGLASQDDSRRALAAGFQLHLVKPVDADRLLAALSELVTRAPVGVHTGPGGRGTPIPG